MAQTLSEHLPDDIVIEIIARLPVKPLLRFQCVSKYWCSLIRSPSFVKAHLLKQQSGSLGVLLLWYYRPGSDEGWLCFRNPESIQEDVCPDLPVPFVSPFSQRTRLLGCNGLVCIAAQHNFVLCNPALRKYKTLPCCPLRNYSFTFIIGLGFGETSTGDIKIVMFYGSEDIGGLPQFNLQAYIFSLAEKSWRKIKYDRRVGPDQHHGYSDVFFRGACHWHSISFYGDRHYVILSMDLSTESFRQLEYPDCLKEVTDHWAYLIVLNDHLGIVRMDCQRLVMNMEVWVMKEYGVKNSWEKQFVTGDYPPIRPLLSWKNDEWLLAEDAEEELVACALNKLEFKEFRESWIKQAIPYKESLVSLDGLV